MTTQQVTCNATHETTGIVKNVDMISQHADRMIPPRDPIIIVPLDVVMRADCVTNIAIGIPNGRAKTMTDVTAMLPGTSG